jgi:hypothetical protein
MPVVLPVWRDKLAWFEGPDGPRNQVWTTWWQEQQDEVVYGYLVEPQSKDQSGMTVGAK